MSTFTCTLPDEILQKLNEISMKLSIPKSRIIKKAIEIYLDQLNRVEYEKSYKMAADDTNILEMAEEGMEDYLNSFPYSPGIKGQID